MYKFLKYGKNINISTVYFQSPLKVHQNHVGGKVSRKMNKNQNNETRKLPGFYIAVCCCVLAIGAAGYFTQKQESESVNVAVNDVEKDTVYTHSLPTAIPTKIPLDVVASMPPVQDIEEAAVTEETSPVSAVVDDYEIDNPDLEASVTVSAEEVVSFVKPVSGEILAQYSDTPIYNSALDDWRTHDGVDIAANEGASVCAAEDGTITSISHNAMGCVVTITHNEGYVTKYMQLESADEFKEGDTVKKGDVIGIIGKISAENVQNTHLHFEIHKDGTTLNPVEVMQ